MARKRPKQPRTEKAEELEDDDDAQGQERKEPLPAKIVFSGEFANQQLRDIGPPYRAGAAALSAVKREAPAQQPRSPRRGGGH